MDSGAYLKRQGWQGDGHSLDHTGRGIKKPLLVSKKVDVLGVGLNKHAAVSDQWWLKAYDQGLKDFGTGKQSILGAVQKHGVNRGGLYGRFVKGDGVPGTIGQSLPSSVVSTPTGTNTPVEVSEHSVAMAVDIPPPDKLERVVNIDDPNAHDAMMHLLQHPEDAPAGMAKLLDRKRKRAERPVEKRARRKVEKSGRVVVEREENKQKAQEEGTWDAEKEAERERMKEINRRAKEFVLEAQRRGILEAGPNEIRKGLVPTGANATAVNGDTLNQLVKAAGITAPANLNPGSGKLSLKAQKYAREKAKRDLKRAARAYLLGEKPPQEQSAEEKKAAKEKKKAQTAEKKAAAAAKEAERLAGREERARKKRESRAKKAAEKAEVAKIMAEREKALAEGKTLEEYYAERAQRDLNGAADEKAKSSNEFDAGTEEIKFGLNSKGGVRKIPGVGVVERYPTKKEKKMKKLNAMAIQNNLSVDEVQQQLKDEQARKETEEREKVDRYRAMKHGLSVEEYRQKLATGEVQVPRVEKKNIDPEKLKEYMKRAAEKGITVEQYIERREKKYAAKQAEKLGNPFQADMKEAAQSGADVIMGEDLGFVVDTTGDSSLAKAKPNKNATAPTEFSKQATAAILDGQPLAIVDTTGNETFKWEPHMPIPLDPRIWEGIKPRDLPKAVRKARKEWMAIKRAEKKARKAEREKEAGTGTGEKKKTKGERKVEAREAFVKQILYESRKAARDGTSGPVTIDGIVDVPLVKVETISGIFKKEEVALARTVARRVLRNVKREIKAAKGKGKGFKKRERAEKERKRNAGISGFTDRARVDASTGVVREGLV